MNTNPASRNQPDRAGLGSAALTGAVSGAIRAIVGWLLNHFAGTA